MDSHENLIAESKFKNEFKVPLPKKSSAFKEVNFKPKNSKIDS